MSTTIRDRIGAATGAAFVVLAMVGNEIASGSSGSGRPAGEQFLIYVARQSSCTAYPVGVVLECLAFVAFIGFLGYLTYALRRARAWAGRPRGGRGGRLRRGHARRQAGFGRSARGAGH